MGGEWLFIGAGWLVVGGEGWLVSGGLGVQWWVVGNGRWVG